jgi:hypothetical protein
MPNSLSSWLLGPDPPPRAGYSVDNDEVECVDHETWVKAHSGPHPFEPTYLATAVLTSLHKRVKPSISESDTTSAQQGMLSSTMPREGRTAGWTKQGERELLNGGQRYRDSETGHEDVLDTIYTIPCEVEGEDMFMRGDIPAMRLIGGPMPSTHKPPMKDDLMTLGDTPLSDENSSPTQPKYLILVDREVGDFPAWSTKRAVLFDVPESSYRQFRGVDSLADPSVSSDAPHSSHEGHGEPSLPETRYAILHPSENFRVPSRFSLPVRAAYSLAASKVILASSILSEGTQTSREETGQE